VTQVRPMVFLFGVAALAVIAFRASLLPRRGLIQYDEAYYALEAKAIKAGIREAVFHLGIPGHMTSFKQSLRSSGAIFPPAAAKPTYILLLAAVSAFPLRDCANSVLAFLTSLACFWIVAQLLRDACPERRGLGWLSAGLLALSPVFGYFSVSGYPHVPSVMFLLAGLWQSGRGRPVRAGVLLGLALSCHYGQLPAIGLFVLFEAYEQRHNGREGWMYMGKLCAALAAPLLAWEIAYRVGRLVLSSQLTDVAYLTYFEQIIRQLSRASAPWGQLADSRGILNQGILKYAAEAEGYLVTLFLLCATALQLFARDRSPAERRLAGYTAGILTFWLLNRSTVETRVTALMLPFLYMNLGCVLWRLAAGRTASKCVAALVLAFIMVSDLRQNWRLGSHFENPYRQAVAWLRSEGIQEVADPYSWPLWQFYLGRRMACRPETMKSPAELSTQARRLIAQNPAGWTIFTWRGKFPVADSSEKTTRFYNQLKGRSPDKVWHTPYTALALFRYEELMSYQDQRTAEEPIVMYRVTEKDLPL
jgi:hypothetical protein